MNFSIRHPLLQLAMQVVERQTRGEDPLRALDSLSAVLSPAQACFVSFKSRSRLRGCVGTVQPTQPSLEQEVVANAVAAATRDPRFDPIRLDEVHLLQVSIDILGVPEDVASHADLDPGRYGLIVRSGSRCGVLLPDLPGVSSASQQEQICREKARIPAHVPVTLSRFVVRRIQE